MIEKFTAEELEIIKKELKELPKDSQKRSLCNDELREFRTIWRTRTHYKGTKGDIREVEDYILNLSDHILANYTDKEMRRNKTGEYCRYTCVPSELSDEYRETVKDIVDVVIKHFKPTVMKETT